MKPAQLFITPTYFSVIWWRYGCAATGEPRIVIEQREYASEAEALAAIT